MDPIKGEKLRAMKSYKKQNNSQIFQSFIVHLLIAIACCLLCSYSHWFPSLYTAKHLLFMSLPNSWPGFFNPRCLFIVVNFIVVFLIGESRLSGRQSSPANEMYNEYVERTRSLRATFQEKKEERTVLAILSQKEDNAKILEEKEVVETKEDKHEDDQDEDFKECEGTDEEEKEEENEKKEEEKVEKKEEEIEQEKEEEEEIEQEIEQEKEEEEEAAGIPAEELNKRVEAFIARVNKQRSLEARFLVCSKA